MKSVSLLILTALSVFFLILAACSSGPQISQASGVTEDPYQWLEEIESPASMEWVKSKNDKTLGLLTMNSLYPQFREQIHSILVAKDRIPGPALQGGKIFNFWQDSKNIKGLWRVTSVEEYRKKNPQWNILLDLDQLSAAEKESWVFKGARCLPPLYERCLLTLSRGGKDAVVVREFDIVKKEFISDGFYLSEAKSSVLWKDENTLWVGTDFGKGSLTQSGYPRIVKVWKRGTPLSEAKQVFEGKYEDISVSGYTLFYPNQTIHLIQRWPSFFEAEEWIYSDEKMVKLPFPLDSSFQGLYQGQLLTRLRTDWVSNGKHFRAGSLLSLPLERIEERDPVSFVKAVYVPNSRSTLSSVALTKNALYLSISENVQGQILEAQLKEGEWKYKPLPVPSGGHAGIEAWDSYEAQIFISYENFLTPNTLYYYAGAEANPPLDSTPKNKLQIVKKLSDKFSARGFEILQKESTSRDGTKIPYFVVHKKGSGKGPTLLYAYGGFEATMSPFYLGAIGKVWLERGGTYVLANIRGGGEFGPLWHESVIQKNRQKVYEDFISVAEDLIQTGVTTPKHLGIMGGSNGGLLMGVMLTQRPDLFKAIVCQVPLLDMLRYHKLLAGASWVGEYGNPDDPVMAKVLSEYSPYLRLMKDAKYPRPFFLTSTKDDRVHPGHARKMVAKMEAFGHEALYFENVEGGHGAAADLEQRAKRSALEYTYLWSELLKREE